MGGALLTKPFGYWITAHGSFVVKTLNDSDNSGTANHEQRLTGRL